MIVRAHPNGDAGVRAAVLLWKDLEKRNKANAVSGPDPAMVSIKHSIDSEDDTVSVVGLGRALHNVGVRFGVSGDVGVKRATRQLGD